MNKCTRKLFEISRRINIVIVNLCIMIISLVIPKTEKIYIIGGWFGERFADNSKYLFLYLNENKKKYGIDKIIWITCKSSIKDELQRKGYESYMKWSIFSVWYHLRAKIHIVDQSEEDINPIFSVRATRINLWHGFPLKNIGTFSKKKSENELDKSRTIINKFKKISTKGFWNNKFMLVTSEFASIILGKAFDIPSEKVIISSYPRNYSTFINNPIEYVSDAEFQYLKLIKSAKKKGKKVIAYLPTFRDKNQTLFLGTSESNKLNDLMDYFERKNYMLVGKFHFAGKNNEIDTLEGRELFINLRPDFDVYSFISEFDLLITDYSSIYYDFLLWKKPIIFFPYDLEYYTNEDRGLIFNYEEYTAGPKIYNIVDLMEVLNIGIEEFTKNYEIEYKELGDRITKKVFDNYQMMGPEHLSTQIKRL